jgi:hypothetical protein
MLIRNWKASRLAGVGEADRNVLQAYKVIGNNVQCDSLYRFEERASQGGDVALLEITT